MLRLQRLRDAHTKTVRIFEAILVGDFVLAEPHLGDLADDVWRVVECTERRAE